MGICPREAKECSACEDAEPRPALADGRELRRAGHGETNDVPRWYWSRIEPIGPAWVSMARRSSRGSRRFALLGKSVHRRMDAPVKASAHRPGNQQTQPEPPSGSQPTPCSTADCPRADHRQHRARTDGLLRVGIGLRGLRGAPSIYAALRSPRRRTKVSAGVGGAEGNGHPAPTKSGIFALLCFPQIGLG